MGKKDKNENESTDGEVFIPEKLTVDINDFDINDIIDLDDIGISLDKLEGMGLSDLEPRMLRGFLWVLLRKHNPGMTLEQAGTVKVVQFADAFEVADAEPDPTSSDSSLSG